MSLNAHRNHSLIQRKKDTSMFRGLWKKKHKRDGEGCEEEETEETASQDSRFPSFDQDDLAKTHFPEFDLDSIPEGELTEISDDDESVVRRREEKYRTKEDQDVAVFMSLAERMSLKSLLFLLQGQARAQNLPPQYLQQYVALADKPRFQAASIHEGIKVEEPKPKPLAKQKKFRFAEVTKHQVREVVHEVESYKDIKDLWLSPDEMQDIRADVVETVRFFRRHRPEYTRSVEIVAKATEPESVIEENIKMLTRDSFARGLESHIVKLLSGNRKSTVKAVLQEQDECRSSQDDYDVTATCLREQSLAYSQLSTRFAEKLGQCDHIDALKASMSRWRSRPARPAATAEFWK